MEAIEREKHVTSNNQLAARISACRIGRQGIIARHVCVQDLDFVFAYITVQLTRAPRVESIAQGQLRNIFPRQAGQLFIQWGVGTKDRMYFMAASSKRVRKIGQMSFSTAKSLG